MAVFGALFLSAALSGLLGVLAGSEWHVAWALAGFFLPGYSLPFVLYSGSKGWNERARWEAERLAAEARERAAICDQAEHELVMIEETLAEARGRMQGELEWVGGGSAAYARHRRAGLEREYAGLLSNALATVEATLGRLRRESARVPPDQAQRVPGILARGERLWKRLQRGLGA
jgi:hypothetical protein